MRGAYYEFDAVVVVAEDTASLVAEAILWNMENVADPIDVNNELELALVTVVAAVTDSVDLAGLKVLNSVAAVVVSVVDHVELSVFVVLVVAVLAVATVPVVRVQHLATVFLASAVDPALAVFAAPV